MQNIIQQFNNMQNNNEKIKQHAALRIEKLNNMKKLMPNNQITYQI